MKPIHPTYKIKQGDNLQTISKLFDFDQDIWVRYHNRMCRLDEIIRKEIPENLTGIYLLPELWDKEEEFYSILSPKELSEKKVNQEVLFGYQNTLPMKVCPDIRVYNILLKLTNKETINTIKYQMQVRWIRKEESNFILEVNKISETYINDKESYFMADELATKVASALYPLELIIRREDGIIGINNFTDIQFRWKKTKQHIRNYHTGETLEKYLRLNDLVLSNVDALRDSLRNDWFFYAYFNKIYETYGDSYSLINKLYTPFVFDKKGVEYTVVQNIDKLIDSQGFIHIDMQGQLSDQRSDTDLQNKLNTPRYASDIPVSGEYVAEYKLDNKYNTIEKLEIKCTLNFSEKKEVAITITHLKP